MADEQYSVKRRIKRNKLIRKKRRGEIRIRRFFMFLRFCLVVSIFYGLYRVANSHYWYFPNDMFTTGKNIYIYGNSIVSSARVFSEIQKAMPEKEPFYNINPEKMVNELEKLPPVKRAYIRRFLFPARLVIMLQEVIPAIVISPSDDTPEVAAYSFDGEFISRDYLPLSKKTHAIKILSYGTKDDYENWDEEKITFLYKLAKRIEYYSGQKVKYIDLRIQNNAFVQLENVRIRLGVLDSFVHERIKSIGPILNSRDVEKLRPNTKYIDLSWNQVQYVNIGKEETTNTENETGQEKKEQQQTN